MSEYLVIMTHYHPHETEPRCVMDFRATGQEILEWLRRANKGQLCKYKRIGKGDYQARYPMNDNLWSTMKVVWDKTKGNEQ